MDSNASNSLSDWRSRLSDGSIFFPYSSCVAFRVIDSGPHRSYECKLDTADLDVKVKIDSVLRDLTDSRDYEEPDAVLKAGETATFCLSTKQKTRLRSLVDSIKNKLQVWAFSSRLRMSRNRIYFDVEDRFEPLLNQSISSSGIQSLASDLARHSESKEQIRAVEHYLQSRWTESRILDFCRQENRLLTYRAEPDPSEFSENSDSSSGLHGLLYSKSVLGKVMWVASETKHTPTNYGLSVKRGKSVWQLERESFHLGSTLTDDDVLKMRIHDTLEMAFRKSFEMFSRGPITKQEASRQAIVSSTPLGLLPDWSGFIVDRHGGSPNVVSVNCQTQPKGTLKAILDDNREIRTITVDGKESREWEDSLAAAKKEMSARYD